MKDGTGVAVHVGGVAQVVITPDAGTRHFHAEFAEGTGLNRSPVARTRMNAIIKRTNPESASEMSRLLKDTRKGCCEQTGGKGSGWKLVAESDHGEFAREVIAAYFVASDALTSEVISELPMPELKRQITKQQSKLPVYFDTCANCTIVPQKDAQELGLSVKAGTAATVAGVGAP